TSTGRTQVSLTEVASKVQARANQHEATLPPDLLPWRAPSLAMQEGEAGSIEPLQPMVRELAAQVAAWPTRTAPQNPPPPTRKATASRSHRQPHDAPNALSLSSQRRSAPGRHRPSGNGVTWATCLGEPCDKGLEEMSASTAIGMVSESLRNLLVGEMHLTPPVEVTILAPDEAGGDRRINLFLYKIHESSALKNLDWQVKRGEPTQLVPPPLSLTLFYLMTPYALNDQLTGNATAHEILGEAMRVFAEYPIVPQHYLVPGLQEAT